MRTLATLAAMVLVSSCLTVPAQADDRQSVTQPELRRELLMMAANDQDARQDVFDGGEGRQQQKAMMDIDSVHLKRIKAIFDEFGFPDQKMVGADGVHSAWLLVQHAGDTEFMARALELARPLVRKGELARPDFARLVDRVRLRQGRKQRYGTQFGGILGSGDKQVRVKLMPIEDRAHVDQRRARMGLGPLAEEVRAIESDLSRQQHQKVPAEPPLIPTFDPYLKQP